MNSEDKGIIDAVEIAMEAEKKASQFYRNALDKVSSEKGKNLLQQLADFEQNHYTRRILSDEYYQMNNRSGVWFWGD